MLSQSSSVNEFQSHIFQGITLLSSPPMAAAGLLGPDLVSTFFIDIGSKDLKHLNQP